MKKITMELEIVTDLITPTELKPFLVDNIQDYIKDFILDKVNRDYSKVSGQSIFNVKINVEDDTQQGMENPFTESLKLDSEDVKCGVQITEDNINNVADYLRVNSVVDRIKISNNKIYIGSDFMPLIANVGDYLFLDNSGRISYGNGEDVKKYLKGSVKWL